MLPLIAGYEFLLWAVVCIVSIFSAIEASGRASLSWSRYVPYGGGSSPLSPIAVPLPPPVVGGAASADVHGYWDIVHGWGCICGVVVLRVAPFLVVALPVILEEGSFRLVVEGLERGSSCKAFLKDAFNHSSSLVSQGSLQEGKRTAGVGG